MLIPVRQNFPQRRLRDVPGAVREEMAASGLSARLKPGSRVGIGVGSRGITNLAGIVAAVTEYWKAQGMRPFIFPAMGSHGAGTAEGQAKVLAHYGINTSAMGCPIESEFDVISLGRTDTGIEAFAGREAWAADGIFVISRVKWHTSFAGKLESGVAKMLAIGMGKQVGAQSVHSHARRLGMYPAIRSVAAKLIATGKVLGGLAILEDAHHQTAKVAALDAETLIEREEALLEEVKSWMGTLPLEAVDVLIIDEIGKNISGTGMDLKVVNRGVAAQYNHWPDTPQVERIFVRDLSALSYGNAVGIGAADVVHDRVIAKMDATAGKVNAVTSGSLALMRTPLHFASDRECIEVAAATVGKMNLEDVTFAWIRNTLELGDVAISESLQDGRYEITGPAFEFNFDKHGNLRPR